MGQMIIDNAGKIVGTRRKLKPTHVERSIFEEGDGSDIAVHDLEIGRAGALNCWEHLQPLTKYAMYSMNEQIHVASWPGFSLYRNMEYALGPELNISVSQVYAAEGQCILYAISIFALKMILDYDHIHSSTLSDGMNSIDEIMIQAGILEYKEIANTDHNQEFLKGYGFKANTHYSIISSGRWKNIHNSVHILFGVEADLLNENGDICDKIQNISTKFMMLSAHQKIYSGDAGLIKKGYLNAISRYGSKIQYLYIREIDVSI